MFNDNDRRAIVQKRLKDAEQNPHVQRVQPDGGFVEDENRIGLRFADLACQLEPLRFAAGQARCFLAEREIAKANAKTASPALPARGRWRNKYYLS